MRCNGSSADCKSVARRFDSFLMHVEEQEIGFRYVSCYCGQRQVVSRRPPEFDKYAVCSRACFDKQVNDGKNEPQSLLREI